MDMFVEFFVDPEFNATTVSSELKAVDYEYQMHKKFTKTSFRHTALAALKTTHKATRFACGNYETLATKPASQGVNIRDLVVSHYLKYYSSNTMDLVIIGKDEHPELSRKWSSLVFPKSQIETLLLNIEVPPSTAPACQWKF
ncbi:metalloprotease [Entomophthora muscae]|uniref:Metalloprotease n=1 Tax=Entomophthora muscae TaxID=34485 RepID=A0ACC2UGF2_9FUNG|nr:metalloprotease [Entomophthora muscae]